MIFLFVVGARKRAVLEPHRTLSVLTEIRRRRLCAVSCDSWARSLCQLFKDLPAANRFVSRCGKACVGRFRRRRGRRIRSPARSGTSAIKRPSSSRSISILSFPMLLCPGGFMPARPPREYHSGFRVVRWWYCQQRQRKLKSLAWQQHWRSDNGDGGRVTLAWL